MRQCSWFPLRDLSWLWCWLSFVHPKECLPRGWPRSCWGRRSCWSGRATMKDSSFWSVTFPRILSTYAIVIFAILWVGFAIALVVNHEWLDFLWNWVRALPSVAEIFVWVFFLPIMVGLWIWESSWAALVRILAFAGIVGWTLLAVSSFLRSVRLGR